MACVGHLVKERIDLQGLLQTAPIDLLNVCRKSLQIVEWEGGGVIYVTTKCLLY